MRGINFLNKLRKNKKLQLVEPNENIREADINKSMDSLTASRVLLKSGLLAEAVASTYYSMYHMLTSLLFKTGIKCENHMGSVILMKEIFDLDNSDIILAKSERIDKQYYVGFKIIKEDTEKAIKNAEEFNGRLLDFISRLGQEQLTGYRTKFAKLIK
ncbi:HEPN domain-containing protein [Candidatus Pacearchaeota archaeon]|nr:HEPN domain-containing protein [Candidatus Pacearchaeota archaeon]